MASKSGQDTTSIQAIEESLDAVTLTIERLKTLYEQYFLGIQKQAPAFIHNDVERKLRDLTQLNIRNTGLRYRLATLQQKFGSYNSYWRRTLREIENGKYIRNLAKIGRDAARNGAEIPEEILAAMPKRMREQVIRDRDQAIAIAKRRKQVEEGVPDDGLLELADEPLPPDVDEVAAMISEPSELKRVLKTPSGAHVLSADDADMDFDAFFSAFDDDAPKAPTPAPAPKPATQTPPAGTAFAKISPTKVPATLTQAITQPIPRGIAEARLRPDTEQDAPLDFDDAATPPSRAPQQTAMPTTAIRRPTAPGVPQPARPTGAIPRPGMPADDDARATTAIPRPGMPGGDDARATTAIPRPMGAAESGPVRRPTMPGATDASDPNAARRPSPPAMPGDPNAARRPSRPGMPPPAPTSAMPRVPAPGAAPAPTSAMPRVPAPGAASGPTTGIPRPSVPSPSATTAIPRPPGAAPVAGRQTGPVPVVGTRQSGPIPTIGGAGRDTGGVPSVPSPPQQQPSIPASQRPQAIPKLAPSQASRPNPVAPGSAAKTGPVGVESMSGPFPRAQTQPAAKPPAAAPLKPPPGMTEADVNALHAKYVKAKEAVGEKVDPGSREKLLKTINQTAPKIMEQYKASGVDFSVVVKDNQVVIKAKPKT